MRKKSSGSGQDSKLITVLTEYVLFYANNKNNLTLKKVAQNVKDDPSYKLEDKHIIERGKYQLNQLDRSGLEYSKSLDYPILNNGKEYYPGGDKNKYLIRIKNVTKIKNAPIWRWKESKLKERILEDHVVFNESKNKVYSKQYQYVDSDNNKIIRTKSVNKILFNKWNDLKNISGSYGIFEQKIYLIMNKIFYFGVSFY